MNTIAKANHFDILEQLLTHSYSSSQINTIIDKKLNTSKQKGKRLATLSLRDYVIYDVNVLVEALIQDFIRTNQSLSLKYASELVAPSKTLAKKRMIDYAYRKTVTILRKRGYHVRFSFSDTITFNTHKGLSSFDKFML